MLAVETVQNVTLMLSLGSDPSQTVLLDADDPFDGLTSKQQVFVSLSFSGLSDIESYRRAYDCSGMSAATIARKAIEVAQNPMVRAKLRQLQDKRDAQSTLAPLLNKQIIVNGIHELAKSADKDSVRLAAYIALGKTRAINLFGSDPEPPAKERSPEDIDRQLLDLIRGMRATIDGNARDVTPSPEKEAPPKQQAATASRKRKPRA